MVMLWGATILFYYIELHIQEYISNKKNGTPIQLLKKTLHHYTNNQPKKTTTRYKRIVDTNIETSIHWNN